MKFVDSHTHLELFALKSIPIERAKSKEELIQMLGSTNVRPLVVWGWNEESIGDNITKDDLNRFPFPLLLIRIDGHMGVVNDKVIKSFNIIRSDKFDPDLGHVYEEELWNIASILKPKERKEHLLRAQDEAISKGIVEVHDFVDTRTAEAFFKLREGGELKISVVLMPYYDDYKNVLKLFDRYGDDEYLKFGWIKIFVDGSIGARTAYLSGNYTDKASRGILLKAEKELVELIGELERRGLKTALHAIGDAAIEVALNALEKANVKLKGHRIEHAEMINDNQATRVREMGISLCIQPNFNPVFMETYVKALGQERAGTINPLKMLDEKKVNIIFGSDMMPFDPEVGLNYASKILGGEKALYYYGGWRDKLDTRMPPQ
ncbi:amidohydrolase family protein [Desulfobacterota bacterium AH_259_B03_O07]|nr:amidohydrolase family protein [Desulfobacterota bacterium AH_259_B03_O07]